MFEVTALHAWYGSAQALYGVDLRVGAAEMVVLQGLNGAGKTTVMRAVMGLMERTQGSIRLHGQSLDGLEPEERARCGLGYVPEDRRIFTDLSVRENLMLAQGIPRTATAASALSGTDVQRLEYVLSLFPALTAMLGRSAAQMSGGEQQMLSIARALMGAPSLLLLDEPCEGIAPVLVERIRDAMLALRSQGTALLVAEQNRVLAGAADRIITLATGRIAGTTEP